MKIVTLSLILIILGLGSTGCHSKPQSKGPRIQVFIPAIIKHSEPFRKKMAKDQLVLEISIQKTGETLWHQAVPTDLTNEIDIPAQIFDKYSRDLVTIKVVIREKEIELNHVPLLQGSREVAEEDLFREDVEPIVIYLSIKSSISEDRVEVLGFEPVLD